MKEKKARLRRRGSGANHPGAKKRKKMRFSHLGHSTFKNAAGIHLPCGEGNWHDDSCQRSRREKKEIWGKKKKFKYGRTRDYKSLLGEASE